MVDNEQVPKGLVTLTIQINPKTGDIFYVGGDVKNPESGCDQPYIGQDILEMRLAKTYAEHFEFGKKSIFIVTTVRGAMVAPSRCVGFYYTYEEAENAVLNNDLDIAEEGYYHYCVIEEHFAGVYNFDGLNQWWFRWHGDKMYHPCEKPEKFKRTVCFGMG